jgi:dUTPase
MKIYVKKINGLILPKRASEVAAGYDIVATSDPKIVGEKTMDIFDIQTSDFIDNSSVKGYCSFTNDENTWERVDYIEYETNLYIAPEAMTFHTLIHPRSSVSKYNLVLANSIGLVDNDYRGMVICRFKYVWQPQDFSFTSDEKLLGSINFEKVYKKGDTIAQLVLEPTVQAEWVVVDELSQTKRGEGGFGSTDKTNEQLEFKL